MITVDIAAMRARIKANLSATLTTYHAYDFVPKNKNHPCFVVSWPDTLDPRATQGGDVDLVIPVMFEVIWLGDESSDQVLMDAMEAAVNAIESDRDLSSNVDDLACGPLVDIGAVRLDDDRVVMRFTVPVEILA